MKSALFWDIMQRRVVIFNGVLEQRIGSIFKGQWDRYVAPKRR
jgi:hypothetical protein